MINYIIGMDIGYCPILNLRAIYNNKIAKMVFIGFFYFLFVKINIKSKMLIKQ